jgi:hypothetical protein
LVETKSGGVAQVVAVGVRTSSKGEPSRYEALVISKDKVAAAPLVQLEKFVEKHPAFPLDEQVIASALEEWTHNSNERDKRMLSSLQALG